VVDSTRPIPYATRVTITIDYADGTSETYTAHPIEGSGMRARVAIQAHQLPELEMHLPGRPRVVTGLDPRHLLFTIEDIGRVEARRG
jgi:hypothetical protein